VAADQRHRLLGVCRHGRNIAERAAEWQRAEQRRVCPIETDVPGDVDGMAGDCLLIVHHELGPAGGARRRER
jgi:hypothetical protein